MNDELKDMTPKMLATRILKYMDRLKLLMNTISSFNGKTVKKADRELILYEYKDLKTTIRADARYVRFNKKDDSFYNTISRNLKEAAAWGFESPVNSQINSKLYRSIEEAHYKLGKGYIRDELIRIASS